MKATVLHAPGDVRLEEVPDPHLATAQDAIVRVIKACVCGSDLWYYRGDSPIKRPMPFGHEFIGVVEEVGSDVSTVRPGDFVIAPFTFSDNTCPPCRSGFQSVCDHGGVWGRKDADGRPVDGGQGEFVRVPLADGTLVVAGEHDAALEPSLLTLSDVMGTGWHAATSAGVSEGDTVAVVGDGAVGLCGVIAAAAKGAGRIIVMSRNAERTKLAMDFGATDIVASRGEEGEAAVRDLTDGVGADAVLECVGTGQSMNTAITIARPGATVGYVGVPHGVELPIGRMFGTNVGIAGGVAPVRRYLPDLIELVTSGRIDPGKVFDLTLPLSEVAEAYAAMDERRAIKALLEVG